MKVLVATSDAQQPRREDFNFALPGEPLSLSTLICSTPEARRECGCDRSFSGVESERSTTYAAVAEFSAAEEASIGADFQRSPHVTSWCSDAFQTDRAAEVLWYEVVEIARLLDDQPEGTQVRAADVTQTAFTLILPDGSRRQGRRSSDLHRLVAAALDEVDGLGHG